MSSETAKPASPSGATASPARAPAPFGIQVLPPPIALIEIVALIVPFTLLDHFVTSFPNLADIQPHPFWLPVLLLSLQYGTMSGLLAASAAILATRDGGTIYFFSMSTSFTKAALGAEGVSRDLSMLIGNGYCPGHADATLALLREETGLRQIFEERFGGAKKAS